MVKSKKRISYYFRGIAIIFFLLLIWEFSVRFHLIDIMVLPLPSEVIKKGFLLFLSKDIYLNFLNTFWNWVFSLILGMVIGLILGFLSGVNNKFEQYTLPITAFIRSIPPIALFPVFLILLGPGNIPIISVSLITVIIYIFPITNQATISVRAKYLDLSKILKLTKKQFMFTIVIPGTIISSLVSSRLAASFAFAICIAGEILIGAGHGIGSAILEYSEKYLLEEAYFYILVAGFLGLTIDLFFSVIQNRVSLKNQ